MSDATMNELLARLEALEAELARLNEHANPDAAAAGANTSRRNLLRYGAVALGAAAAGLVAKPAEAADGNPVLRRPPQL